MSTARLVPHLICRDASTAIDFYQRALGAESMLVLHAPDGKLMHARLQVNGGEVFLCDEFPSCGALSPQGLGGSPVTIHLQVDDCDAWFARALAAGCEARMPPEDMFWGDRYAVFVDPFGHAWSVATTVRTLSAEELASAAASACVATETAPSA